MRIVAIGVESQLPESWRPDCIEGLRQLGHRVESVRDAQHDDLAVLARGADVLLWLKGGQLPDAEMRDCLRRTEAAGTVTIGLHLDLYHGVPHRENTIGGSAWWTCQYVFTADGADRDWLDVNHYWCPPAFGTRHLGLAEPDPSYRHAAVFVGSVLEHIHGPHRTALTDWAAGAYGARFARYGGNEPIWGADLNRLYASAELALADSACLAPYYWSATAGSRSSPHR